MLKLAKLGADSRWENAQNHVGASKPIKHGVLCRVCNSPSFSSAELCIFLQCVQRFHLLDLVVLVPQGHHEPRGGGALLALALLNCISCRV